MSADTVANETARVAPPAAPETATGGRDWPYLLRVAQAACEVDAARQLPESGRRTASAVVLDAQTARNLWRPPIWVLAAATIVDLQAQLAAYEFACVWDPPPGDDRYTVYYEDEDIPDDAVPLYRKNPVRVIGGVTP